MNQPNFWLVSALGLLINLAVTFGLIMSKAHEFIPKTPEKIVEEVITIGSPEHFDFLTQGIEDLAANLKEEKKRLYERERLANELEERLAKEKDELLRLREEIASYREELTGKVFMLESSEEKNLKSLAVTYSNMPAETAVSIFSEMDDTFVLKIMSYMSVDVVAPIFQVMPAERVARFTDMMRLKTDAKTN